MTLAESIHCWVHLICTLFSVIKFPVKKTPWKVWLGCSPSLNEVKVFQWEITALRDWQISWETSESLTRKLQFIFSVFLNLQVWILSSVRNACSANNAKKLRSIHMWSKLKPAQCQIYFSLYNHWQALLQLRRPVKAHAVYSQIDYLQFKLLTTWVCKFCWDVSVRLLLRCKCRFSCELQRTCPWTSEKFYQSPNLFLYVKLSPPAAFQINVIRASLCSKTNSLMLSLLRTV